MDFGLQLLDELIVLHQNRTNQIQHGCLAETILSDHYIDIGIQTTPFERGVAPHGVDNDVFNMYHRSGLGRF